MTEGISGSIKEARREAYLQVSDEFSRKDKRDVVFILTLANLVDSVLHERPNVHEYLEYAVEHQEELLSLAREFDNAIENFNETAGVDVDPEFINTCAVRAEDKLGRNGTVPKLLGEGLIKPREAIAQFKAGEATLVSQNRYMSNSEMAELDTAFLKTITESGSWSRLHLEAKSSEHFLATLMIDLYPGMLKRWLKTTGGHEELDTDELARALCESLDPKSGFFRLIKDQGWFVEGEFSKGFIDSINNT